MVSEVKTQSWIIGNDPMVLDQIHNSGTNIAIYDRDITALELELNQLANTSVELEFSGDAESIRVSLEKSLVATPLLLRDINSLVHLFEKLTKAKSLRLKLATINMNMCRKFHTDINDLRMLCTYSGPGTLWLKDENVNRRALSYSSEKEEVLSDENHIEQVDRGSVVVLKGALYPSENTHAIVHRSPSIEESKEERILLRIDTNEFLNFDL